MTSARASNFTASATPSKLVKVLASHILSRRGKFFKVIPIFQQTLKIVRDFSDSSKVNLLPDFSTILRKVGTFVLPILLLPAILTAETPTTVKARLFSGKTIGVTVKIKKKFAKQPSQLSISRSVDGSGKFYEIARIHLSKGRKAELVDVVQSAGKVVSYKSRMILPKKSRWSKKRTVSVATSDEISPDPSPTKTPTTPGTNTPSNPVVPNGMTECTVNVLQEVLQLVNQTRTSLGLAPLANNTLLYWAAKKFSLKMAQTQILSHDGWSDNILSSGYAGSSFGQNIGYTYPQSPTIIVNNWLESAGHRRNILSPNYKHMGVGCIKEAGGRTWWTQNFGG